MDKRKTQRILSILVIIALVIILFPLLFNKNEVTTQTATVTAPAFPDKVNNPVVASTIDQPDPLNTTPIAEPLPANANNNDAADTKQETVPSPLAEMNSTEPAPATHPPTEPNATSSINNTQDTKQSLELNNASPNQTDTVKVLNSEEAKNETSPSVEPTAPPAEETVAKPVEKKPVIKSSHHKTKTHYKPARHHIAKLNKPAWIVQMGSFKNIANARHLTDKLRAAGFNAFTREIKTAKGGVRTHVYVGPEFKEASAAKISRKIQHDLNLQSIVLPYNPLAL